MSKQTKKLCLIFESVFKSNLMGCFMKDLVDDDRGVHEPKIAQRHSCEHTTSDVVSGRHKGNC